MSKLATNFSFNEIPMGLLRIIRDMAQQINGISEGSISAHYAAQTAAPSTGIWRQGDFVLNSSPAEAGSAGSKYLVHGWRCTVSGTPGTWLPVRTLTGN